MQKVAVVSTLVLVVVLAACGGAAAPSGGAGDAAAGKEVFANETAPACGSCHSLKAGVTLVGPSLANIGAQAGSMEAGKSDEQYLRESITDPNAFVVEGFPANVMPTVYGSQLTSKQIDDLVAYLLSLK
jgi:mono/diheme cytochrome c family protein